VCARDKQAIHNRLLGLDVNQNVYTQSAVAKRQLAVNRLESSLNGVQTEFADFDPSVIH
jgi:hypothetical protein